MVPLRTAVCNSTNTCGATTTTSATITTSATTTTKAPTLAEQQQPGCCRSYCFVFPHPTYCLRPASPASSFSYLRSEVTWSQSRHSSPLPATRCVSSFLTRKQSSTFFPRRLASNYGSCVTWEEGGGALLCSERPSRFNPFARSTIYPIPFDRGTSTYCIINTTAHRTKFGGILMALTVPSRQGVTVTA